MFTHKKLQAERITELEQKLSECELLADDQRIHMLCLRQENAALRAELEKLSKKSSAVGDALICAMRIAENIKSRAKFEAEEMLREAKDKCAAEEQRLDLLCRTVAEFRHSLLAALPAETESCPMPFASGCD